MSYTVLLYGATGFSGRLIAAEGRGIGMANGDGTAAPRMILAGRDGDALARLAEEYGMEYRVFGLHEARHIARELRDINVVINAAGPFARTALPLLKAAINAGCHYVDINGELDVYMDLGKHVLLHDVARRIEERKVAVVCSAGYTAAASDLLMNAALDELRAGTAPDWGRELGAVRIALSCTIYLSGGSAETVWRSLREQVTVVRGKGLSQEPVGKLEHTFDFRGQGHGDEPSERDLRVASAANLVDTVTAQLTIANKTFSVRSIESYVEAGTAARIAYQASALLAPFARLRPVQFLAQQQISCLPLDPTDEELRDEKEIVLLDIEDPVRTRIVDWRWETPNAYQFTAQVVVEIAKRLISDPLPGWVTPGAVLRPQTADLSASVGALRKCHLSDRLALRRAR
jgi:short subunit dehydrogenase-like uncharacterized protein